MFKTFLEENYRKLDQKNLKICIGNEACDCDSFLSSLVLSYSEDLLFVVNMSKEIFQIKDDMKFLLEKFNIDIENLIFLEKPVGVFSLSSRKKFTFLKCGKKEINLADKEVTLTLVDHNTPIEELDHLKIDLIIDHHQMMCGNISNRVYIDPSIGSCATLISKYINFKKIDKEIRKSIAEMLQIPIIVDTKNFKGKFSKIDKFEFKKLKKISGVKKKEIKKSRKLIKKGIRNDDSLTLKQILSKDFKRFKSRNFKFGCSTIKIAYKKLIDRETSDHFLKELTEFRREHGLDFIMLNRKKKKERFLLFDNFSYENSVAKEFNFKEEKHKNIIFYKLDAWQSRKVIVPKIIEFIDRQ